MEEKKDKKNKAITHVEVEAMTVAEAIEKALAVLKVGRDDIDIKVLSEEKKGLFGMAGAKQTKIHASLKKKESSEKGSK